LESRAFVQPNDQVERPRAQRATSASTAPINRVLGVKPLSTVLIRGSPMSDLSRR
jgi:hypothetical protein